MVIINVNFFIREKKNKMNKRINHIVLTVCLQIQCLDGSDYKGEALPNRNLQSWLEIDCQVEYCLALCLYV